MGVDALIIAGVSIVMMPAGSVLLPIQHNVQLPNGPCGCSAAVHASDWPTANRPDLRLRPYILYRSPRPLLAARLLSHSCLIEMSPTGDYSSSKRTI